MADVLVGFFSGAADVLVGFWLERQTSSSAFFLERRTSSSAVARRDTLSSLALFKIKSEILSVFFAFSEIVVIRYHAPTEELARISPGGAIQLSPGCEPWGLKTHPHHVSSPGRAAQKHVGECFVSPLRGFFLKNRLRNPGLTPLG